MKVGFQPNERDFLRSLLLSFAVTFKNLPHGEVLKDLLQKFKGEALFTSVNRTELKTLLFLVNNVKNAGKTSEEAKKKVEQVRPTINSIREKCIRKLKENKCSSK